MDPKGLFNLFKKFGVVNDVFIPHKRRRITASRFGFVRFSCQVAANVAMQKANGLWVDGKVVKLGNTGEMGAVTVKVEKIGNGWLYESLILCLRAKYTTVNMKMELEARGTKDAVVRKGGGRDLILSFNSNEEMKLKMKDVKEIFGDWCEEVVTRDAGKVLE
ncbi:uncharacterized protein LOC114295404 [Camellia sinensis]|uniref:uncharacterized protein LOC114295404 n=1 Tax=Camellia sinensis TaxID=4442 RepID=UPI001035EE6F|nr:uncharacterized protein LOC114295404 [Camellia sinensis]